MNKNLDRRIHPIAEADGLSPKKLVRTINKKYHKIKLNSLQKVVSYKLYLYLCKSFGK